MTSIATYESTHFSKKKSTNLSIGKYLLTYISIAVALLAAIIVANYKFNPLVYSIGEKAQAAKAFINGSNYGVFDSNFDMRGLRREHIRQLTETPQVVVAGGSRFQEALPELFPGRSFYNAHIHSDYVEDMLALTELLIENNRLPETLVLSVRYQTFMPIDQRNSTLWKNFAPEYRAMATRLNIPNHSWLDTIQPQRWLDLLSLPALKGSINQWLNADVKPGPTQQETMKTLDVIGADGSLRWSQTHLQKFTPEFSRKDALKHLEKNQHKTLIIDPQELLAMERLLALLREQGVQVVLVQTPFHPDYYNGIAKTEYGKGLRRIEAEAHRLAKSYGALAVGSFDPGKLGCPTSMFIDWHHAVPECLQKIFAAIPSSS